MSGRLMLLLAIAAIAANAIIGAAVWESLDDDDHRLLRWYMSINHEAWAPLFQFLVLQGWPVGLWLWWRERRTK